MTILAEKFSQIAQPLKEKISSQIITEEVVVDTPEFTFDRESLSWLDKDHLMVSIAQNIEIIHTPTMERISLGRGCFPKFSPDKKWIAYLDYINNKKQLFIREYNGVSIRQLTFFEDGLQGANGFDYEYVWSPTSHLIAISRRDKLHEIYLGSRKSGSLELIYTTDYPLRSLFWSKDEDSLIFMMNENAVSSVNVLNLKTYKTKPILSFNGIQQLLEPSLSPDSRFTAVAADVDYLKFNIMPSICLLENDTENFNRLTFDMKMTQPQWSSDSSQLYALRDYGPYNDVCIIDVETKKIKNINNFPMKISTFSVSPCGSKVAWVARDAQARNLIGVSSVQNSAHIFIDTCEADLNIYSLSEVREIRWSVEDYSDDMRGILVLPLNYDSNKSYPLIVDIHGGGPGASAQLLGGLLYTTEEWHMWAAKGYAVFVPEFRSSGSYSCVYESDSNLFLTEMINDDIVDIERGVDSLIASGMIDPDKMAVIGASAGGRRANWLAVSTNRYKAIISKEGWSEEKNITKYSALRCANRGTTPVLFLMGNPELGGIDVDGTTRQLHQHLKNKGISTEYIEYLDEGHIFKKKINKVDALRRAVDWIERYLN